MGTAESTPLPVVDSTIVIDPESLNANVDDEGDIIINDGVADKIGDEEEGNAIVAFKDEELDALQFKLEEISIFFNKMVNTQGMSKELALEMQSNFSDILVAPISSYSTYPTFAHYADTLNVSARHIWNIVTNIYNFIISNVDNYASVDATAESIVGSIKTEIAQVITETNNLITTGVVDPAKNWGILVNKMLIQCNTIIELYKKLSSKTY